MMKLYTILSLFTSTCLLYSAAASEIETQPLSAGDTVPDVAFQTRVRIESSDDNPFDWLERTSSDYFKHKRVVIFALPGAFTPTCSASHLPGYENNYDAMKALGIDEVYCLSVNDAFVMRQWGLHQG